MVNWQPKAMAISNASQHHVCSESCHSSQHPCAPSDVQCMSGAGFSCGAGGHRVLPTCAPSYSGLFSSNPKHKLRCPEALQLLRVAADFLPSSNAALSKLLHKNGSTQPARPAGASADPGPGSNPSLPPAVAKFQVQALKRVDKVVGQELGVCCVPMQGSRWLWDIS